MIRINVSPYPNSDKLVHQLKGVTVCPIGKKKLHFLKGHTPVGSSHQVGRPGLQAQPIFEGHQRFCTSGALGSIGAVGACPTPPCSTAEGSADQPLK
mmetsp:Transcript_23008/g.29873  ORF Transcript_23008/g.29873 Transcript_23008/m.29873 type:complete len:97 (+) Transcript_23008:917-1207(+)